MIARLRVAFFTLTAGRPMEDEGYAFTFNGEVVHYYRDQLGRKWMASPGSAFRVRRATTLTQDMKVWAWRTR